MKNKIFLAIIPCALFLMACDYDGTYETYENPETYTKIKEDVVLEAEQLTFQSVYVGWHKGNVNIIPTDTGTLTIKEEINRDIKEEYVSRYLIANDTLYLRFASSGCNLNINIEKDLTIYINTSLDSLKNLKYEISSTLGNIEVNNIAAEDVRISLFKGDITLNNCSSNQSPEIGVQRGNTYLNNFLFKGNLEVAANYGKIDITLHNDITGFIPDFRIVDGTSIVYAERFPESSNFYGSHMSEDVTITVTLNHGDLTIF